jgi:hypothetical protein
VIVITTHSKCVLNEIRYHVDILFDLDEAIAANKVLQRHLRRQVHPRLNQVKEAYLLIEIEELPLLMDAMFVLVNKILQLQHIIIHLFDHEPSSSKLWATYYNAFDSKHGLDFKVVEKSEVVFRGALSITQLRGKCLGLLALMAENHWAEFLCAMNEFLL